MKTVTEDQSLRTGIPTEVTVLDAPDTKVHPPEDPQLMNGNGNGAVDPKYSRYSSNCSYPWRRRDKWNKHE